MIFEEFMCIDFRAISEEIERVRLKQLMEMSRNAVLLGIT